METGLFQAMAESVIDGDNEAAAALAARAIEQGIDPLEAINQGYVEGMDYVGDHYGRGEMFLPDLVLAGEAMKAAVAVLEPEMARRGSEREVLGKVILGTVKGDIHEIGKTLVGTMLAAAGFRVFDLGVDVETEEIVTQVKEVQADIVGLSALLTTTMASQKEVIEALEEAGVRQTVRVIVGGAPVTREWAAEIGADGYSEDAIGAVAIARQLMAE